MELTELQTGQKFIIEQFDKCRAELHAGEFIWKLIRDDTHDGAMLVSPEGDHVYFTRERLEDAAYGTNTQRELRLKIKERVRRSQTCVKSRADALKHPF